VATRLKEVDVVIAGLGWTGGILAKELSAAGLKVVALERGGMRSTEADFSVPTVRDELRYVVHHDLMMNTQKDTLTIRNNPSQEALPMRRLGSFLPGEGVGGAGVHWNGHTWRWTDMEFKVRSLYEERYGKGFIPADMTIQDWGITYAELEPYYDRFEYVAGISGKAGNLEGRIRAGGNPFEAPRAREYPLPPLQPSLACELFEKASRNNGYHPFPRPTANASRPYTNPDGAKFGACQYCGYCERFGCEANAKGSPHMTVIPIAMRNPNFELRTHTWVTKVLKDAGGKRVTGVTYTNVLNGEEFEQPAQMVMLCAYAINNVHLMLLSGIGQPYDPVTQRGVIGKNYCYQTGASATLFFEGRHFNPFMLGVRPREIRLYRRLEHQRRHDGRAADRLSAGARGHASVGQGMESRDRQVVRQRDDPRLERQRDGEPLQLLRSRPHLPQCVRPAADAHDLRLQGKRAQDLAAHRRRDERARKVDEPVASEPGGGAHRSVDGGALSEHAQHRRHHHGHPSGQQRGQQVPAELGLPQSFHHGRERVPAQFRLQPDRAGRRPRVLGGGRAREPLSEKSGTAGVRIVWRE
jgi:hypothetical protein